MKISLQVTLVASTCLVWSLVAHSGEAPETELKTTAVAAFKNGLAFVVKQGDAHLDAGVGNLSPVPNATLGFYGLLRMMPECRSMRSSLTATKSPGNRTLQSWPTSCWQMPARWLRSSITIKRNIQARSSGFGKLRSLLVPHHRPIHRMQAFI